MPRLRGAFFCGKNFCLTRNFSNCNISAKGGISLNYKILGLFGIIFITVAITYRFAVAPVNTNTFVEVSEISSDMSGLTRETRGVVTELNEAKGHVFFTLKDPLNDKKIRAVMFAKTNADDPNRKKILCNSLENRSVVRLRGEVDVYKGELEIKTWQVYEND